MTMRHISSKINLDLVNMTDIMVQAGQSGSERPCRVSSSLCVLARADWPSCPASNHRAPIARPIGSTQRFADMLCFVQATKSRRGGRGGGFEACAPLMKMLEATGPAQLLDSSVLSESGASMSLSLIVLECSAYQLLPLPGLGCRLLEFHCAECNPRRDLITTGTTPRSWLQVPFFVDILATTTMGFLTVWTFGVVILWVLYFGVRSAKKTPRWCPKNPSNLRQPPRPISQRDGLGKIVSECDQIKTSATQQIGALAEDLFLAAHVVTPPVRRRRRTSVIATSSMSPSQSDSEEPFFKKNCDFDDSEPDEEARGAGVDTGSATTAPHLRCLAPGVASTLDMSHVYLSFIDFFWGTSMVGLGAIYLGVKGPMVLFARRLLRQSGLCKQPLCDYPAVVGQMMLESMLVMLFTALRPDTTRPGNQVALFVLANFALLDEHGKIQNAKLLTIDVSQLCARHFRCTQSSMVRKSARAT
eukprot:m.276284 g.276284  ORF g.276284 m.276284 type:complete len:473 (-) comp16141_c0_seq2:794-2212(-)